MAVILAGGKGTRLRPFTMAIPKPLLPLGDVPIIEVVLQQLANAGVHRIVITLGHMAHLFVASIGDGFRFGINIEYCTENSPLGTAGSLRLISDPEEHMLVMNGDILTTLDYVKLLNHHIEVGASATIAVHRREAKIDYGVVETTPGGQLYRYVEKPVIPYVVSMGINIISQRALEFIPLQSRFDMPQLMQTLVNTGHTVECYESDCYWQDIGRFDDYQQASADFSANPDRFLDHPYLTSRG